MHRIFITGGAGYVGVMLAEKLSARADVEKVICLDKEEMPDLLKGNKKIEWLTMNTADAWEPFVEKSNPDIVIHTAWQIREMYGKQDIQWKWNVDGSDKVFDYAFSHPNVKRLVHFSTVASYGAFPSNTTDHFYQENEAFRKTDYLYAEEKRIAEAHLQEKWEVAKSDGHHAVPQVFIIRPAAITGPRGRYMRIRFGLQSALSGSLKGQKSALYNIVSAMVSWVPATPQWLRQYIHEDDITDIVELLALAPVKGEYEAFNAAPPGAVVFSKDMAEAVGKRTLPVSPWMVRLAFFVFWHGTRGKIPTSRGSWKGYSYPIAVDGSKITNMYGFKYSLNSKDAFSKIEGRYAKYVNQ